MKRLRSGRRMLVAVTLAVLLGATLWMGSFGLAGPASAATDLLASNWTPAKAATGVAVSTNVSVKFNQDLAGETITPGTFYLTRQGDSWTVPATVSYNASTRVATIDPVDNLQAGSTYIATLTDDIESATGQRLTNSGDWSFTTDTFGQVLSRYPAAGAVNVSTSTNVTVSFDRAISAATMTASSFHLESAAGQGIPATVTLSADRLTATLDPSVTLVGGMMYVVRLDNTVRTETGVEILGTPLTWTFTTVLAPRVVSTVPASDAVNQPANQVISVTFDQDMDQSTVTSGTFFVSRPGGPPLSAVVVYSPDTRTATLTPAVTYQAGERYIVTLTTAVKGMNGATLTGAPYTWLFTVLSGSPAIASRIPESGATGVSVNQSIHVTFNVDMNPATISWATLYVQPVGGSPLPATVTYDAVSRTATIDPAAALANETHYQVTLSAAVLGQSALSLADAPVIWFFVTEKAANTFSDVIPGKTPYAAAIAQLSARGIITGFLDGTFRPYQPVSRQQFAKMIVLSLELPVTGLEICPFTDVVAQTGSDPLYPLKYVAVCAFHGITQGKTPKSFAPYDDITRQQLITMIARAAEAPAPPASYVPRFKSSQFSTSEHYQNACKAEYAGLLADLVDIGPGYDFRGASTRGECAQLLWNLIAYRD